MAPKKANNTTAEEEPTNADLLKSIKDLSSQFSNISGKMAALESELSSIKTIVVSLRDENKELKQIIKEKDEQLSDMQEEVNSVRTNLNNLEQHHRGWSARVLNIHTTEEEQSDPAAMIDKVFRLALLPILEGAVRVGKLKSIPSADQVLEVAHVLPGKPGHDKPIIMRFYSRNIRNLIFSLKRDHAERETDRTGGAGANGGGGGSSRAGANGERRVGKFKYPLYDDLTKLNLSKLKAISHEDRVLAAWTVKGQIRFKLKNSDIVRKVVSVFDPIDTILNS